MEQNKTFTLIVEGKHNDPTKVAQHALELVNLVWNGDVPPDVVKLGYHMLVKVGKYLAPGDRYQYRIATVATLTNGRLILNVESL
jgi:hypothetical protein